MSQLKYIVEVDDSDFKKKLAEMATLAAKNGGKMAADTQKKVAEEIAGKNKVIEKVKEQAAEVRKLNLEISRGDTAQIKSGTVVSPNDIERAKAANDAYAASVQKTNLALKGQDAATKVVSQANKAQMVTLEALKLELVDYQTKAAQATNPKQLKLYNSEIQVLQGEIGRMSNMGKTGFDEVGNAAKKSTGYFTKAWSGIRTLANILPGIGIAGLAAFAIEPIMKYIKQLDIFKAKTSEAESAQRSLAAEMGEAGAATAKATIQIDEMTQKFYLAKRGIISKQEALNAYNEGIGKTLGATTSLNIAEERTIANGDAYVELMFKKARAAALMGLYTKEMTKAAEAMAKTDDQAGSYILSGTKGKGLKTAAGTDVFEASAERNRQAEAKPFNDMARRYRKMILDTNNGIVKFAQDNGLNIFEQMAPKAGGSKAVAAASDIFQKIADLKEEYTRKAMTQDEAEIQAIVDKFQRIEREVTKFNADPKNKIKVDTAELNEIKDNAIAETRRKQQEEINKRIAEENEKSFSAAWEASMTHAQKLVKIEEDYQAQITALQGKASQEQLDVLKAARDQQVSDQVSANLKIQENWESTFDGITGMSRKSVEAYLAGVKKKVDAEFAAGKLTADQYKQMTDQIGKASDGNKTSFGRLGDSIKNLREELTAVNSDSAKVAASFKKLSGDISDVAGDVNQIIGTIAQSVQQLNIGDENTDKMLSNVMGVVDGIGELGKGISSGNPIAIVTGSIKLLSSALGLFDGKDRKLQKQIDGYKNQLDSLGTAYRKLEKDISNSVGNSYYADSDKAIANMKAQIVALERMRKAESEKKKTDKGTIADIDNQIIGMKNSIEETEKAISEMLLQSNFKQFSDNLANALVTAFEAGEDGINAMNKTFDDFIKNAIANALKLEILEPIVKDMMEAATEYGNNNKNSLLGFNWEEYRTKLAGASEQLSGAYENALKGLKLGIGNQGDTGGGGGMSGMIGRSITEATAAQMIGIAMPINEVIKRSFKI